eukprot:scaffold9294_cov232-Skeletonema_dohrnii-CCMP3373.AAC.6
MIITAKCVMSGTSAILSVSEMTEGDVTERRDDRMEGDNFRCCGGKNGRRDISVTTGEERMTDQL